MDRSPKQNINKDILELNYTLHQMDLTDIYRSFLPKEGKYAFFSNAHGTFFKGILRDKTQYKSQQIQEN